MQLIVLMLQLRYLIVMRTGLDDGIGVVDSNIAYDSVATIDSPNADPVGSEDDSDFVVRMEFLKPTNSADVLETVDSVQRSSRGHPLSQSGNISTSMPSVLGGEREHKKSPKKQNIVFTLPLQASRETLI